MRNASCEPHNNANNSETKDEEEKGAGEESSMYKKCRKKHRQRFSRDRNYGDNRERGNEGQEKDSEKKNGARRL